MSSTNTSAQFGLRILVEPPNSSTSPLNIIFVHGLGGSPEGTWTDPETNSFWPPWLSKVKGLENSRIMTFGYDSGWNKIWKPNNVLDISDFARQLVNHLWCHYTDYENVNFAIYQVLSDLKEQTVFVTHSMGGLVVKKVLDLYQAILRTILIFAGTDYGTQRPTISPNNPKHNCNCFSWHTSSWCRSCKCLEDATQYQLLWD